MHATASPRDQLSVVMVCGDFPPMLSGVGDYCAHVSRSLGELGHKVGVVTTVGATGGDFLGGSSVVVEPVVSGWQLREFGQVLTVADRLSRRCILNLQYHCPGTYGRRMLINALPGLIRMVRPAARVVVTMHGFREQGVLFRLRALPMLRLAHGVIFVDRKNERLLGAYGGHGSSRLRFIPIAGNIPPVEVTVEERRRLRRELGFGEEDVVVAFFGGIGRSKGFHHLVKAVELARTEFGLSAVLLAIGGFHEDGVNRGYQEQMKVEIGKKPASDWVKIITAPPPARASELLRCADVAAYPFLDGVGENSGSMMAALAHGLPTVATKGHGNPPDFEDHFGVALVPQGDSLALAEKIVVLANSPGLRLAMKRRAMEVTAERSWPSIAAGTAGFFQVLIQGRGRE